MPTENKKQAEEFSKGFEKDYNLIMQHADTFLINQQWTKAGDCFEIFTLYNDKTPVIASGSTLVTKA
ncbi:hypothetical protein [Mucilaginibacter sp. OK268]|uniref:hypothetical protein n=1 Tax=Mucilaginibacter sp. OK268 TaxID=1881048 RepID=UPI000B89C948|nr:hypothetical protein [Mucilaginibacter sp. OK268]